MLSVNSVQLFSQPTFKMRDRNDYEDAVYVEDDNSCDEVDFEQKYHQDKSVIEEQMEKINNVINNNEVAKPLRTGAKVISVILGAALGAIGLKYGTTGMIKVGKDSYKMFQNAMGKPLVKNTVNKSIKIADGGKKLAVSLYERIAKSKAMQKVIDKFGVLGKKYAESKTGTKVMEFENKINKYVNLAKDAITNSKVGKAAAELSDKTGTYFKGLNSQKIENGVVDLFTVSGAVTGGLNALDMAVKEQA